jgi:hypothetical protein
MLVAQLNEVIINGMRYFVEVTKNNEIILKRYRADYKIWVTVSYSSLKDEETERNIRNALKKQFIIQIENDVVNN